MNARSICVVVAIATLGTLLPTPVLGQARETAVVQSATSVLNEIMAVPMKGIPIAMLADAQGVAIVPDVIKAGFVVGGRHGRGVLLVRDEQGNWQAPVFISVTGGSVGWQIGVQSTDVVLVFKTRKSVEGLLRGKFTIGADMAAAAGPVGRRAEVATDAQLKSEIYSYSRSRGLFAGVSLDGAMLQVDSAAACAYYYGIAGVTPGAPQPGQPLDLPASAATLIAQLTAYTTPPMAVGSPMEIPPGEKGPTLALEPIPTVRSWAPAAGPAETIKGQLAQSARQLDTVLDDNWRHYLALPGEVFSPDARPSAEVLATSLRRFDALAGDAQYSALLKRPEFRRTHELLKSYVASLTPRTSRALSLPPPPAR